VLFIISYLVATYIQATRTIGSRQRPGAADRADSGRVGAVRPLIPVFGVRLEASGFDLEKDISAMARSFGSPSYLDSPVHVVGGEYFYRINRLVTPATFRVDGRLDTNGDRLVWLRTRRERRRTRP
jgi:hypothetical protein